MTILSSGLNVSSHDSPSFYPSATVLTCFLCKTFLTSHPRGSLLVLDNCLEGAFVLLWHGDPCLGDEWQQILPPQMPCSADKRSWQRARWEATRKVGRARLQGIWLPAWYDSDIWEVTSGLVLSLHSSCGRHLTFGNEGWLPCLMMALN